MLTLYPFILEHATQGEGSKYKVHVKAWEHQNCLCGLNPENHGASGGTTVQVDLGWINQPDPTSELCKMCKKSAIKILNHNK